MVATVSHTNNSIQPRPISPATPPKRGRAVIAAGIGNTLEWYDFAVYAFSAAIIAPLFFPGDDPIASVLATLAVFAVGFLMRPVGAILFGRIADLKGRKTALIISVTLMGIATVLIGVLPTHAAIGALAPVLLTLARLAQGLSLGGEFSASTAFLVEYAPPHRRGLFGSIAYFNSILGSALGGTVVLIAQTTLSAEALESWGWRIPFLLSLPLLLVAMYIRSRVSDSPEFKSHEEAVDAGTTQKLSFRSVLVDYWPAMLRVLGITVGFAITSYTVISFMASYLTTVVGYEGSIVTVVIICAQLIASFAILGFGWVSDKIGRKRTLLLAASSAIIVPILGYSMLWNGIVVGSLAGQLILWIPAVIFCGAAPAAFAEMFPTKVRVSGFGVAYAFGTAIFSGTAPYVSMLLVQTTDNVISPAWYIMASGVISLIVILTMRETAWSNNAFSEEDTSGARAEDSRV